MDIHENFPLKNLNTFGIAASAAYFSAFRNRTELEYILDHPNSKGNKMILGGGSNVLFTGDFNGMILKNEIDGIEVINETETEIFLKAGAGVAWHSLVMYAVKNNWGGLENLSLIPGNVGASPMQNIGAYGVEIKDIFEQLTAFHLAKKEVVTFNKSDCEFGYRESVFKKKHKNEFAILDVTYRLQKFPTFHISYGAIEAELEKMQVKELSIQNISQAIINIRTSKLPDPKVIGNAGSFFKNPVVNEEKFKKIFQENSTVPFYKLNEDAFKIPAAWLIEQCGWKGFRNAVVGCYEKQPLVLVNFGGASGQDIFNLSEEIIHSISEKFDIYLEREVNVIN